MDAQILQDVGKLERLQILRSSAAKSENFTYPKGLTGEEVTGLKDHYTKNAITMAKHEERKKDFMTDWKADVKPLKLEMGDQMTKIRSQVEEITEEVYLMPEHSEGFMGYYNQHGILVYQRPLMPDEKQFSIVDLSDRKEGTNK